MDMWKVRFCGIGILLMSVISSIIGLQVSILKVTYEVARGDEVIITCNFQPKNAFNQLIIISWSGDPDESFDDEGIFFGTFYSNDNHVDINAMYEGKAQIESDVNEKVSKLLLKHVTLRESRRIKCHVQIPGDTDGQTSASTSLVVLVAPSDPVCKIKGKAEYGQNISLTCASEEGSPAPTYQWESYDVKSIPRPFPPKATQKDGVLSLFNVSIDTSGYYICTSTNMIRSAKCNLTLAVMPSTMKIGTTAGIIGGCVAGIAVLVLIIYCCCRDKKQPEEFAMEPTVIEYHDRPKEEKQEAGSQDVRRNSIEGWINQRERNEMKTEKDSDRNSNQRFDYNDLQEDKHYSERYDDRRDLHNRARDEDRRDRYEDRRGRDEDRRDRYEDCRGRDEDRRDRDGDRRDRDGDRRDCYDDRKYRFTDQRNHDDDRRGQYDQYDDRQNRNDGRRDHVSDERDRYDRWPDRFDDRRDRYDNPHERPDDGRGDYRHNRYDDNRTGFKDGREDNDDRQGRFDNPGYRYDDRQDHYNDHRDRYERRDQSTDRHEY